MAAQTITIEAINEGSVLLPLPPLPLTDHQQATLTGQVANTVNEWPTDVTDLYREIAEEDQPLAAAMWSTVKETWPHEGEQP